MSTGNTDSYDLAAVDSKGVIREEIMEKIWQIDSYPLPFTDKTSKITSGNSFKEFVTDELGTSATDNKHIDGVDVDQDDSELGERQGNYHQTALKEIQISKRANAANSVGRMGTLSYQVSNGQKRLRRDVESQMITHQPSIAGDSSTPGQSAGIGAQLKTNVYTGATGSAGGFNHATGVYDAPTPGTPAALSETTLRDAAQAVYEEGGNTTAVMGTPNVIRLISEYLFSDTARVATMTNQDTSSENMTAYGSANVFITDFGQVLRLEDNRLQKVDDTDTSTLYLLDPQYMFQSFITGYQTEPLAKTGLSEKRLISCDYSLIITAEKAQGAIMAIDETAAMVA